MVFQSTGFSYPLIDLFKQVLQYRGTRNANAVRDADQQARLAYSDDLIRLQHDLEQIAKDLAKAGRFADVREIEELVAETRRLSDRVRTAPYGYSGIADEATPDGSAMTQLLAFDGALVGGLSTLTTQVGELSQAVASSGDVASAARTVSETLRGLQRGFDLRGRVMESGSPVDAGDATNVLRATGPQGAPLAWTIDLGRPVSVAGSRHVVDGKIGITTAYGGLRFFRLSSDPGAWLLVTMGPNQTMAVVRETPAPEAGGLLSVDGVGLTSAGVLPAKGEPVGPQGSGGVVDVSVEWLNGPDQQVGVILGWGATRQAFAGKMIDPSAVIVDMSPRGE